MCMKATICTRRRFKCVAKYLVLVIFILAYVFLLVRESYTAIEESNRQRHQAQRAFASAQKIARQNRIRLEAEAAHKRNVSIQRAKQRNNRKRILHRNHRHYGRFQLPVELVTTTNTEDTPATVNPIYEYSDEMNAATALDLAQRQTHLWETCQRLDMIGQHKPNAWEFFLSPGHSLSWCNVFKAASSTWLYYFNILAGYDIDYLKRTKSSPLEMARREFPRPSLPELEDALTNSLSFLFVREPFERLLSAYRDKLENLNNNYYRTLGEQIMKTYRKGYVKRLKKKYQGGPTFREFIMYIMENHKRGGKFDEHWAPVYMFCTPCSVNYTVIAKVDTFQRDSEYIIRQAGLETILFNKMPRMERKRISNISSGDTKKEIYKYFSQLDTVLLEELLSIYQPDFELFGYTSSKYHDIVQHSPRNTSSASRR